MGAQRVRIRSGSDEEAGSRPSDELVLSTSSFILVPPAWRIRPDNQVCNQNMRLSRVEVNPAIIGPKMAGDDGYFRQWQRRRMALLTECLNYHNAPTRIVMHSSRHTMFGPELAK